MKTLNTKEHMSVVVYLAAILFVTVNTASAQFPIKVSKIPKAEQPKQEQPKTADIQPSQKSSGETQSQSSTNQFNSKAAGLIRQEPNGQPILLKDTVEIKIKQRESYWKFPNQNDYSSWIPQISFHVFYDDSAKLRYQAEWFNADGSPWFSETLRYGFLSGEKTVRLSSDSPELLDTKAVVTAGTYSVKVTNQKTSEVVFQGKFKVNKIHTFPGEVKYKNRFEFYVDNDWSLPVGYVGFNYSTLGSDAPQPMVFMWFKDRLNADDFEARLIHNGQEITSTDEGGVKITAQERGNDCLRFMNICQYHLWQFYWENFAVDNGGAARKNAAYRYPKRKFSNDFPGEYTIKIFYKGTQVREANFTIDQRGGIAPNAFSNQIYLTNYKIAVPVKVTGTLDKWNPNTWKTDMFYGNPLTGFSVQ